MQLGLKVDPTYQSNDLLRLVLNMQKYGLVHFEDMSRRNFKVVPEN
jgi:hypothetical protein